MMVITIPVFFAEHLPRRKMRLQLGGGAPGRSLPPPTLVSGPLSVLVPFDTQTVLRPGKTKVKASSDKVYIKFSSLDKHSSSI